MPNDNVIPEINVNEWMSQDRAYFLDWISDVFKYSNAKGSLFDHQRFVRDYLQGSSPYRGLLLYHTLGVGKTCASIAASEALRFNLSSGERKIYVMTTKMLHDNFVTEVPTCTRPELLRDQKWSRVVESRLEKWVVDENGTQYEELSREDQEEVLATIESIIDRDFHFVHYNGLTSQRVAELTSHGSENPFDSSVVVIDEVHNFISRAVNKRLILPLYERLVDAQNCKIILLSGTPIVNRIAEIAPLVNLVQGSTIVHEIQLRKETTLPIVERALSHHSTLKSIKYDPTTRRISVVFLPPGFVNASPGMVSRNLSRNSQTRNLSGPHDIDRVVETLEKERLYVVRNSIRVSKVLPLPTDLDEFDDRFLDWENSTILNPVLLQRRMIGAVSTFSSSSTEDFARVEPMEVVHVTMSPLQFGRYNQLRAIERRRELLVQRFRKPKRSGETDSIPQLYRTYSLALCTFAFPTDIERPFKYQLKSREDFDQERPKADRDREYEDLLKSAVDELKEKRGDCLVGSGLAEHSPKFSALLDRLDKCPGTSLVYSEFRRPEGLGLFAACLDANRWEELRIVRIDGEWSFSYGQVKSRNSRSSRSRKSPKSRKSLQTHIESSNSSNSKKRYIVLRTEEATEVNRMLLDLFNNKIDKLPKSLQVETNLHQEMTNLRGEMVKALLITSSGAEGLSLHNVRQVHLIEAYWNHNRIDQVIGRAVRTRSHVNLPVEERRVSTFLYLADLSDEQREDRDVVKFDKGLSSDQYIYSIAMKKKHLTDQMLHLIASSSVDCRLWSKIGTNCLTFPKGIDISQPIRTLSFTEDVDDSTFAKKSVKLNVVEVKGQKYYMDPVNKVFYDYESLKVNNSLVVVDSPV